MHTLPNDDVRRLLRLVVEVILQDLLGTIGIAELRVEGGTGVMRDHPIATAERVLHRTPRVVLGRRLDIPYITRISVDLASLDSCSHGLLVTDRTTGGVHEPCALLEVLEQVGIHEPACTLVQGAVHGHDVALGDKLLQVLNPPCVDSLCGLWYPQNISVGMYNASVLGRTFG